MKNLSLIISSTLATIMLLISCGSPKKDDVPSEEMISKMSWMPENLNVDKFRNGDPILEANTNEEWEKASDTKQPAWCYYDNNPVNGAKYGKLYNWYAVKDPRGLAPEGYHIPSDAEWNVFINDLGGASVAGEKMKSKNGWKKNGNGTDKSGFNGLPAGLRYVNGPFDCIGTFGYWWSSVEFGNYSAWFCSLNYKINSVNKIDYSKGFGFSVRCLRD